MPRVAFTPHLQRFLDAPARDVAAATVGAALEAVFVENPRLRGYILDDAGQVRRHVSIFVDDRPLVDRACLSDAVSSGSEIFVLQALSGG